MQLNAEQLAQFERDGFLVFPGLFSADEASALSGEAERVAKIDSECVVREGSTGQPKSMFRLHEPDGATASPIYRSAAHCPRVLGVAQQLLRDDALYLHHCKVNMKAAIEGTAWPWHQDFIFWKKGDGMPNPDAVNVAIFLDEDISSQILKK